MGLIVSWMIFLRSFLIGVANKENILIVEKKMCLTESECREGHYSPLRWEKDFVELFAQYKYTFSIQKKKFEWDKRPSRVRNSIVIDCNVKPKFILRNKTMHSIFKNLHLFRVLPPILAFVNRRRDGSNNINNIGDRRSEVVVWRGFREALVRLIIMD